MKQKPKLWIVTLDNGEFTTEDKITAKVVTRPANTNTLDADGVRIQFGANIVGVEESK